MSIKSRGNWNIPECVKFDCGNRRISKCRNCIKFSNYEKREDEEPDRSKHPHY